MGLVELQYGIEKPHRIGSQLQKNQPYSLLIYIYFYCQSSEKYGFDYHFFSIFFILTSKLFCAMLLCQNLSSSFHSPSF